MTKRFRMILIALAVIACICYTLIPYPSAHISDSKEKSIDSYMLAKLRELHIPGAAVGIVHQDYVFMKGYGRINSKGQDMTPQTPVHLGSTTKSITAVAVMQLVEKGKLNLDDPVVKYLPDFSFDDRESSSVITVRQLLNQTSGVAGSTGGSDYLNDRQTAAEFVDKLKHSSLSMNPGESFKYAEANYVLLGQIIEAVSGKTYASYIEENIFQPLDMVHSYTTKKAALQGGLSDGFRTWFGLPLKADLPHAKQYLSASGLYSCVEDLSHYVSIYLNNGSYQDKPVISDTSLLEIMQPSVSLEHPVGYSYGMGWYVGNEDIVHDGRPTNYYSVIVIEPQTKRGVVLLANVNNRLITAEYMMPMAYDILHADAGIENAESSFGFRQIYRVLNLVLFFMIAFPLYRLIKLIRMMLKKELHKKAGFVSTILFILPETVCFAAVFSLLLWLLNSFGVSLPIAFLGQPDIVFSMITSVVLMLATILLKITGSSHCG